MNLWAAGKSNPARETYALETREQLVLAYLSQAAKVVPYFLVSILSGYFLLSLIILPLMVPAFSYISTAYHRKIYNRARGLELSTKEYLHLNMAELVGEIVLVTFLVVVQHVVPVYFPAYSGLIVSGMFYVAVLIMAFALAPLTSWYSQRMSTLDPGISNRFDLYAKEIGISRVAVYSVPWARFRVANAFQMGPLRYYYVFITDYLVSNLTPDELDFVILHELFHARRKHIARLMVAVSLLVFLLATISLVPFSLIRDPAIEIVALLSYLYFLLAACPLIMAWVSRNNENEADLFAVRFSRNPAAAMVALEKLGQLNVSVNFYSRYRLLRTHPPIAERIARIEHESEAWGDGLYRKEKH